MFSWYKVAKLATSFSHSRIPIIPGIWRHFQELPKFQELDVTSKKNFSSDLLSTYVLLIQSRKIGHKFFSFENPDNSRNLTSFPRTAEILGIWRHFQELPKLFEFFDFSKINSCSKFFLKFIFLLYLPFFILTFFYTYLSSYLPFLIFVGINHFFIILLNTNYEMWYI